MDREFEDLELTPKMADVIKVFLQDPAKLRYGFELMRATGQPSGTLYPILAKFEKHGWLTLGTEDIDPRAAGRPARRFYTITGAAVTSARIQLAALHERYRLPAVRSRLQAEGDLSRTRNASVGRAQESPRLRREGVGSHRSTSQLA